MEILFDSQKTLHKKPFGCVETGKSVTLSLHIPDCCRAGRVRVIFENDEGEVLSALLFQRERKFPYTVYETTLLLPFPGLYFYFFKIETADGTFSLYKRGSGTNMEVGDKWQLSVLPRKFETPAWAKGAVFYQIFPDRFYKERLVGVHEKKTDFVLHTDENDPPVYLPNENGEILNRDFFGGNLQGIIKKLPYLASLSVDAIYLNPIFEAYSNHRYDTADYLRIDPLLGTEADFRALCKAAHERGIRIVLDGVFSHTGSDSRYFDKQDRFGGGAYHDPASPYREWYQFEEYPHKYASWWGIDTLPAVNELSPSYLDFIIEGEDSVVAHWLRAGADGFRLDVADELPDEFIARLRRRVKEIKPDAIVIGEVWEDASSKVSYGARRKYFTDGELDSVMNYPFRDAIIGFLNGSITAYGFKERVTGICENYPSEVLPCLLNSLSTHDTPRILTLLSEVMAPETREGRALYRLSHEDKEKALAKLYIAVALQFALPGAPCIYYGDEAGLEGYEDPFNRRFFPWGKENASLLALHRALGELRRGHSALRFGDCRIEATSNDSLIITRTHRGNSVFFAVSRRDLPRVKTKKVLFEGKHFAFYE